MANADTTSSTPRARKGRGSSTKKPATPKAALTLAYSGKIDHAMILARRILALDEDGRDSVIGNIAIQEARLAKRQQASAKPRLMLVKGGAA